MDTITEKIDTKLIKVKHTKNIKSSEFPWISKQWCYISNQIQLSKMQLLSFIIVGVCCCCISIISGLKVAIINGQFKIGEKAKIHCQEILHFEKFPDS